MTLGFLGLIQKQQLFEMLSAGNFYLGNIILKFRNRNIEPYDRI